MGYTTDLLATNNLLNAGPNLALSKFNSLLLSSPYGIIGKDNNGRVSPASLYDLNLPQFNITTLLNGDKTVKLDLTKLDITKLNTVIDSRLALLSTNNNANN